MQVAEPVLEGVIAASLQSNSAAGQAVGIRPGVSGVIGMAPQAMAVGLAPGASMAGIAPGAIGFVVGDDEPIIGEAMPVAYPPQALPPG